MSLLRLNLSKSTRFPYGKDGHLNIPAGVTINWSSLTTGYILDFITINIAAGGKLLVDRNDWCILGCRGSFVLNGTIEYRNINYGGVSTTINAPATHYDSFGRPVFLHSAVSRVLTQQNGGNGGGNAQRYQFNSGTCYLTHTHGGPNHGGSHGFGNGGGGGGGVFGRDWWEGAYGLAGGNGTPTAGGLGGPRGENFAFDRGGEWIGMGSGGTISSPNGGNGTWSAYFDPRWHGGGGGGGGGFRGGHGGQLYIISMSGITGSGNINLSGSNGGNGGAGATGHHGIETMSYMFTSGGGGGGGGGAGGNGGTLYLRSTSVLPPTITVNVSGGNGGAAGANGGPFGPYVYCGGQPSNAQAGQNGLAGSYIYVPF